jgi:hypothetical protein
MEQWTELFVMRYLPESCSSYIELPPVGCERLVVGLRSLSLMASVSTVKASWDVTSAVKHQVCDKTKLLNQKGKGAGTLKAPPEVRLRKRPQPARTRNMESMPVNPS